MRVKKTKYNSLEKDYVRNNSWINILDKLLKEQDKIKFLEMVGDTPTVWWDKLKPVSKDRSFEASGVAMNNPIKNREKYTHLYIGRYDKLLKESSFLKSFPYNFINLDYYGGGRWFNEKYQYNKIPDIHQTIVHNISLIDGFYLAVTIDMNDKIYPWFKDDEDIILSSAIKKDVEFFLDRLENVDDWNLWLAIIGNCLIVSRIGNKTGCCCDLVYPPYTYIGESAGHKSRMISYLFYISRTDNNNFRNNERDVLEMIKKTRFVKWMRNTGKIIVKKIY